MNLHLLSSSRLVLLLCAALLVAACQSLMQQDVADIPVLPEPRNEIVKSPTDQRQYRALTLDNQLEVVLVSDPTIEKSAAALSVGVGSFQEPQDFGGLAHYLEHMLFLGTQSYPDVNEYSEFVSRNGGTQNAYTELDHTNYMVAVNNSAFDEALQRFSGFFYEATLNKDYADKERNAVHAEWSMKSPNGWVILSQLDGLTLNPSHPIHQFNWGNLSSLNDHGERKLQDQLVAFYQRYYSANLMKAALISQLPLDEMAKLAREYFGKIPNKQTPKPQINVPVATAAHQAKLVRYAPQADMKQLRINFVINNNTDQFAVKPNGFVNYILNNEMPGTLASTLRDAGLSEGLYTSFDADGYGNAGNFMLYIDLSDKGVSQRDRVMAAVLKYLQLLREQGVDQRYFKEIKQSLSNSFRFKEKSNDYNYAMEIAAALQQVPTAYVLSSEYEYQRFDPKAIQQVLDQLTLDKARVFYIDKQQPTDTDMAYFVGRYQVEDISAEQRALWRQLGDEFALRLPRANSLMPEDFSLVEATFTQKPVQLVNQPGYSAFLAHSAHFEQPKGRITLDLNSSLVKSSARHQVIGDLLNRGLSQRLTELQNEAIGAGMGLSVTINNGLSLTVNGFNDKQASLIEQTLALIVDYQISADELSNAKAALKSDIYSKQKNILLNQLLPKFSQIISLDDYSDEALLAEVDSISAAELGQLKRQLFKHANLRVFAFGNYSQQQVEELTAPVLQLLPADRQFSEVYESPRLHPQPGQSYIWQQDMDLNDIALIDAYISARNDHDSAAASVLSQLLQPALFNQIRTEEQLAYAVGFISQTNKDQMLNAFYIQSPVMGLADVDARIKAFRANYANQLAQLSQEEFNTTKDSVLINLTQPPKNLAEEMSRWLADWREQNYAFDRRSRMIDALNQLTLADVIGLYQRLEQGQEFGQVVVQMRGANFVEQDFATRQGAIHINNIDDFHQQHKSAQ